MLLAILALLLIVVIALPQLWVRWVFHRHGQDLPSVPGTGAELATHLLKRFELDDVRVEQTTENGDHYDPEANAVRLGPRVHDGRSLTAIAVAAHEVGHALQFNRQEPVVRLRQRYFRPALALKRLGATVLALMPLLLIVFRIPHPMVFAAVVGVATMLVSVLLYVAILPEEWDASFGKALPILEEGAYVQSHELPAVRRILTAAALTYVAAALADILNLARWFALLRGAR